MARLDELKEQDISRFVEVSLIGTINCAAHAIGPMIKRGKGSIVNVTSGAQMGLPTLGCLWRDEGRNRIAESVCEAFARDLANRQAPLGIVWMDAATSPNPSDFWSRVPDGGATVR